MKLKSGAVDFTLKFDKRPLESKKGEGTPPVNLLTYKTFISTSGSKEKQKKSSSQSIKGLTVDCSNEENANKTLSSNNLELQDLESAGAAKQEAPNQMRPYPKKVFFIMANEFCERFSFYGLRTVLVLYMKNVLDLGDSSSTIFFHLFAALCYIMPVFGAILADSMWGKFKTILNLSIVYLIGEIILVISSIFWDRGQLSTALTFFGLIMIGLGTGGIKPCVAPFGGDQFLPHEEKWRQSFFSMFYGSINIACLLGMFLAPILKSMFHCVRRSDCYPVAFSVPCGLMLLAILLFLIAKNKYLIIPPPEQNIIVAFCKCIRVAIKQKLVDKPTNALNELPVENGTKSTSFKAEKGENQMNYKNTNTDRKTKSWLYLASHKFSEEDIQNFQSVLHAFLLLIPIPMFYCLHDQQGSLWTLQANRMDGRVFNTGFSFEPDQIIVSNPVVVLLAIPILDLIIYPFLNRRDILVKPHRRMTFGGILTALAFVTSALIEFHMQRSLPPTMPLLGHSNLLFVNGLDRCSVVSPIISHDNQILSHNNYTEFGPTIDRLRPFESYSMHLAATNMTSNNNYQLKFRLESLGLNETSCSMSSPNLISELDVRSIPLESTKLLYLQKDDNKKLNYYLFNESLQLPEAGKARIRLLYVTNPATLDEIKADQFALVRTSEVTNNGKIEMNQTRFARSETKGKISISEYKEVGLPTKGDEFIVYFDDRSIIWLNDNTVSLKPGTRNLVIVQHDVIRRTMNIHHELLQDNDYYVSMLYQIIPYALISVAEVMIAVTGLSYLYLKAPKTMKAVIFGAWYSTTAIGNLLTVLLESTITFSNITNKFLFYAALMVLDSLLLNYIGSNF